MDHRSRQQAETKRELLHKAHRNYVVDLLSLSSGGFVTYGNDFFIKHWSSNGRHLRSFKPTPTTSSEQYTAVSGAQMLVELFDSVVGVLLAVTVEGSPYIEFGMVIFDLKLGLQLKKMRIDHAKTICKLEHYPQLRELESCAVAIGANGLSFWKFSSEGGEITRTEYSKLQSGFISSHSLLYEMQNGWVVSGRMDLHGGNETLLFIWDLEAHQQVQVIYDRWDEAVFAITELWSGHLATSCTESVKCWDVITGQETWSINRSSFSPDPSLQNRTSMAHWQGDD